MLGDNVLRHCKFCTRPVFIIFMFYDLKLGDKAAKPVTTVDAYVSV